MADAVSAHPLLRRPGAVLHLVDERAELWSRRDRAGRLADGLERRAASVAARPSATTSAHPRLTASGDLIDELVAIDAAVVADVLAVQAAEARLRANLRAQAGWGERARMLVRSAAALATVAVTLVMVGVVR